MKKIKKQIDMRGVMYMTDAEIEKAIGADLLDVAIEYTRRREIQKATEILSKKITGFKGAVDVINPYYIGVDVEAFYCIYLRRNNTVIGVREISRGGLSSTVCDMRILFKYAIELQASGLILAHNHPSGEIRPSQSDAALTDKARDAAKLLDMQVLDHIIIAKGGSVYSFADEGLLC